MVHTFTDQTGNQIILRSPAKRIISLVPSQTELLFDLGLNNEVAGITKFCIHPHHWFTSKNRVGGTKNVKQDVIERIGPDLIIANKEENVKSQLEELKLKFPVWISDIINLEDALHMIASVGEMTNKKQEAALIINTINNLFTGIPKFEQRTAAYLIWKDPIMAAGSHTFINEMMLHAGFENVFVNKKRYPDTDIEEIKALKPQYILLSSEPFPFNEKHVEQFRRDFPGSKVLLVDGEMFSWYGSRLAKMPEYFIKLQQQIDSL